MAYIASTSHTAPASRSATARRTFVLAGYAGAILFSAACWSTLAVILAA